MKSFTWLLTAAMGVLGCSCWVIAEFTIRSLQWPGYQLPYFTGVVLQPHGWLLFLPLPWVIYSAILSFWKNLSPNAVFIFAGTLVVAMTVVACGVTLAGLLPFFPLLSTPFH